MKQGRYKAGHALTFLHHSYTNVPNPKSIFTTPFNPNTIYQIYIYIYILSHNPPAPLLSPTADASTIATLEATTISQCLQPKYGLANFKALTEHLSQESSLSLQRSLAGNSNEVCLEVVDVEEMIARVASIDAPL